MSPVLLVSVENDVALLTLNRPEASNALSEELRQALDRTLDELGARKDVRAIVLTGSGERAFCGGLDRQDLPGLLGRLAAGRPAFDEDLADRLASHSAPVIAAVNGTAMTGGLELLLGCDIVVASRSARFADTHARVGVAPMWGMTQRLPRRIGQGRAKFMSLSGLWVEAPTALTWGLVDELADPDQVLPRALEIARAIAAGDPSITAFSRRLIGLSGDVGLEEGLRLERLEATAVNEAKARQHTGSDT